MSWSFVHTSEFKAFNASNKIREKNQVTSGLLEVYPTVNFRVPWDWSRYKQTGLDIQVIKKKFREKMEKEDCACYMNIPEDILK